MTIRTLPAPCWHRLPITSQDEVNLADWDPHCDTEAELRASEDADAPVKAEQYESPCKILACDGCGEEALDDDTGGVVHFPPAPYGPEPSVALVEFESFDGRVLCGLCEDKAQRDELRKVGG